jgi:streptomycin 3"-adenylyltransferase
VQGIGIYKGRLILSKKEGGGWGLSNIPEKYRNLISTALEEYQSSIAMSLDEQLAVEFVDYMLAQIRKRE